MKLWRIVAPLWYKLAKIGSDKRTMVAVAIAAGLFVTGLIVWAAVGHNVPVLDTHGLIANQQRDLIYFTLILGGFVVIPVFIILFVVIWKYRASNPRSEASYAPDYDGNNRLEALWWGIPALIIVVLGIVTGITTFALDPYKAIESDKKPITVQVIAMQWKWLFIYPDQQVASLQQLVIPEDTPINFTLTSDAPMNSFWIPALAGQVYAMSGMSTKLHIVADKPGEYMGTSANISGDGFADMKFVAKVITEQDFATWSQQGSPDILDMQTYNKLAEPGVNPPVKTYKLSDADVYNEVVMKYMHSGMETESETTAIDKPRTGKH